MPVVNHVTMPLNDQLDVDSQSALGASVARAPQRTVLDGHRDRAARIPKSLGMILAVGLALRLVLLVGLGHSPQLHSDEPDYNDLAVNLVEHGAFAFTSGVPTSLVPTSLRPPLYPAFVAGIYWLFGLENWPAVGAIQALLSLGTVWIVYRLGTEVYSTQVGLWAGALACFYPSLLGYNNLILSEVLFTFLLCSSLLALVRGLQNNSLATFAVSGVLLGLDSPDTQCRVVVPDCLRIIFAGGCPGRSVAPSRSSNTYVRRLCRDHYSLGDPKFTVARNIRGH